MYSILLPVRYLLKRPLSWIAAAAIAICVFIVVIVMTVMNGLVVEFREKNHRFVGDCIISTDSLVGFAHYEMLVDRIKQQEVVEAVSVVVKGFGLLTQAGFDRNIGIEIMGIDPVAYSNVTHFNETLHYRKDDLENAFIPAYNPQAPGCIVGIDMMPKSRDRSGQYYHSPQPQPFELIISCFPLTAKGALAKAGTDIVNTKTFFYSDDSRSGLVKVDARVVYLPFEDAQLLTGMAGATKRANAVHIKFKKDVTLQTGVAAIRKLWQSFIEDHSELRYADLFKTVSVQSWKEFRRETIAPMEKEQIMLTLAFILLAFISIFIVFVVFYMIIGHKSKDIGILRSVGVSQAEIVRIFLCFALMIAVIGSMIGTVGGVLFLSKINDMEGWLFEQYGWQLWDRSIYAIGQIPNDIRPHVIAVINVLAFLASVAGAVIPAVRAAGKPCAEILQVNQI